MLFRVTDIETVPDLSVWTPGPDKWRARPGEWIQLDDKPGNLPAGFSPLKPRGFVTESNMVYEREEQFQPAHANRVVAVAWCDILLDFGSDKVPKTFKFQDCQSFCRWGSDVEEAALLCAFREEMVARPATLVTWNGRGFDLPVLAMRAMHRGVPWGWYYDSRDIRYRYTDEGHCDLMDYLSDFGAARSMKLDDACRLVGLPGKAAGGEGADKLDGSMVAGLVERGPGDEKAMARVARYCLQDVLQTALLFVRTRHHLEILDARGYDASLDTFRDAPKVRRAIDVDWDKVRILRGG